MALAVDIYLGIRYNREAEVCVLHALFDFSVPYLAQKIFPIDVT